MQYRRRPKAASRAILRVYTYALITESSYNGDVTFENIRMAVDVSGVIDYADYGSGPEPVMATAFSADGGSNLRFIDADVTVSAAGSEIWGDVIFEGKTSFVHVSTYNAAPVLTTRGEFAFADFTGTLSLSYANPGAACPAAMAYGGFTVNGTSASTAVYGAAIKAFTDGYGENYYTFVNGGGNPLSAVTVAGAAP